MQLVSDWFPNSAFSGKYQHFFCAFFFFSAVSFLSFVAVFSSRSPHVPPPYFWLFQCCLCPAKPRFGTCLREMGRGGTWSAKALRVGR